MSKRKNNTEIVMELFGSDAEAKSLYDLATYQMKKRGLLVGRKKGQPKAAKAMGQKVGTVMERSTQ